MVKPIWEYFFDKKSHVANLPEKDSNEWLILSWICVDLGVDQQMV